MNATTLIASNTVRQIVRQRLFYNVVLFGVGLVLFAMIVSNITFGYPDRVVRSIGLSGVSIALDVMALLLGANIVHEEIDRKTLFVLLSRPVARWQYVGGRYLGIAGALMLMTLALTVVFAVVLTIVNGQMSGGDGIALGLAFVEAMVLGSVGVMLSCFTTPTLGVGMGVGAWLIGASSDDLIGLTEGQGAANVAARVVSYVFPALSRFNFREAVVYDFAIDPTHVLSVAGYGLAYAVAMLALASIILQRREMV